MTNPDIDYPPTVSRAEWLKARVALLAQEKELTKARDRLNAARRELPMVHITKSYVFESTDGTKSLIDLFEGRHQLVVYHFMWHWEKGQPLDTPCKGCAGFADQLARGHLTTLHQRNTALALVTRAPMGKVVPFNARMGWKVPMYSSFGTHFNHDFGVTMDSSVAVPSYNYLTKEEHAAAGTSYYFENEEPYDLHGLSCFLRKGDEVYHTYSSYARGVEDVIGSIRLLDQTALGRQEEWEQPKGRAGRLIAPSGPPPRYPDEYGE
jgi:predicted dithiol-disulfide oxidoreductase (DUF899 family)